MDFPLLHVVFVIRLAFALICFYINLSIITVYF